MSSQAANPTTDLFSKLVGLKACVDLGGTKVAVSLANSSGMHGKCTEPTTKEGDNNALAEQIIRMVGKSCAQAGLNQLSWDLLVDPAKALEVEALDIKTRTKNGDLKADESGGINAKETPYAQAKKYGWPQYIQPGDYIAQFQMGSASSEVKFKVSAPKALESRAPAVPKVRGK